MSNENNAVQAVPKNIADKVIQKVNQFRESGMIHLPKDYSAPNALKAAWLILLETETRDKKPVLTHCTQESIANALLKMVVQGLNPVKRQCSFIAYGKKLTCQREYQGSIALAKRLGSVKDVRGQAIYEADEFETMVDGLGRLQVKHKTALANVDPEKLIGAYAIIEFLDGSTAATMMNMTQIVQAWKQGATKGQSPAHKNFPDQMAIKTVINRACKPVINSSSDSALFGGDEIQGDPVEYSANAEVAENANGEILSIEPEEMQGVQVEQSALELVPDPETEAKAKSLFGDEPE